MKILTILIALFLSFAGLTVIYSNKAEAANDHNWEKNWHNSTEVKCQQYKKCKDKGCDARKTRMHHTYGDWEVTTTANCMTDGIKTRTCSVCGNQETKNIGKDPNTHVWGEWIIDTPATCIADSGTRHHTCTNPAHTKTVTETQKYKDLTNHAKGCVEKEYVVTKATCLSPNIYQKKMSLCGQVTGNIPAGATDIGSGKYKYITTRENKDEANKEENKEKYSINLKNHVVGEKSDRIPSKDQTYYITEKNILYKVEATAYLCDKNKGGCGVYYYKYNKEKVETEYTQPDPPEDTSSQETWDLTAHKSWQHTDEYTGLTEILSQKYSGTSPKLADSSNKNKKTVIQEIVNILLCKHKHGSIRFTPTINHISGEPLTEWLYPWLPGTDLEDIKGIAKGRAETLLTEADYYKPSTNVSGIYKRYVGTWDKVDNKYSEGEWVTEGEGAKLYWKKYAKTPVWSKNGITQSKKNDKEAYVLSSGPSFSPIKEIVNFNKGNYKGTTSDEATDQLIQDALWKDQGGFNEGGKYNANNEKAINLLKEGEDYEDFYNEIHNNGTDNYKNKVEADTSEADVVVNRNDSNDAKKDYTVGPFSVNYPGGEIGERKFSYIENMQVIAKNSVNGKEITLEKGSFEIVTISNGISKDYYPYSGEKFWIRFNAAIVKQAIGEYPTSVKVDVTFAYLERCSASYDEYEATGEVWQIVGHIKKVPSTTKFVEWDSYPNAYYDKNGKYHQGEPYHNKVPYFRYEFSTDVERAGSYTAQKLAMLTKRQRTWKKYKLTLEYKSPSTKKELDLTMELGGQVWSDALEANKETGNDSKYDPKTKDQPIPNLTVTLYTYDDNGQKVKAKLASYDNTNNYGRTQQTQNPTKTDANGRYLFTGINSMKRYFVEFTYNSQYYEPVEYISPKDSKNGWAKGEWKINSNGTDVRTERETINARFASIGSSPNNYIGNNGYNETFTRRQLMGYELQSDGSYKKTKGNEKGYIIDTFLDCTLNHTHTSDCYNTHGNLIMEESNNSTEKKMIQYVKDCMLNSYTGKDLVTNNTTVRNNDLYPIYTSFAIAKTLKASTMEWHAIERILNIHIYLLYEDDANLYINQGYSQRRASDLALQKDVKEIYITINGKDHTYKYDKRKDSIEWDIGIRLADNYYNTEYSREIQPSDYIYKIDSYDNANAYGKTQDSELKVYITYKIRVKNESQSVKIRLDEIVDYYDKDLSYIVSNEIENKYIQDHSYATIGSENGKHVPITRSPNSRYGTATEYKSENNYNNLYVQIENSPYLSTGEFAYIYLTFIVNKDANRNVLLDEKDWKLNSDGTITATSIGVGKENMAEINGYSTIYGDNTKIANIEDASGEKIDLSGKPAGIVDKDSNPGNLNPNDVPKDLTKEQFKHEFFEDDTDKAPNIKLKLKADDEARLIDGVVWEDIRNDKDNTQKTNVANGLKENGENGINGVTVQLVELMENGTEYVWSNRVLNFANDGHTIKDNTQLGEKDTYTKANGGVFNPIINMYGSDGRLLINNVTSTQDGYYAFKSYPAGNYVVRYIYGDTVRTVLPNAQNQNDITKLINKNGDNAKSYTGQDYKSTSYQKDISDGKSFTFRNATIYSNNNDKFNVNESGKFAYDITASDAKENVSDAKDIMTDSNNNGDYKRPDATLNSRVDVETYSKANVKNHIAEVLASHEQLQKYYENNQNEVNALLEELMNKTAMTAETGVIDMEIEKDSNATDNQGVNNKQQYKIQNVNLGLEERPKAQLEINKEVTNVKLTLADGSTLFDAKQTASNVLWKDHKNYDTGYKNNMLDETKFGSIANIRAKNTKDSRLGLIQLSMDEELMHGAKIQITYQITVTNVGEVDYKDNQFYYTGKVADKNTIVKTTANQIIDYVANNLQFDSSLAENTDWEVITQDKLITQDKTQDLVNKNLKSKVERYNTIITTKENATIAKTELVPDLYDNKKSSASTNLVLTQLITAENKTDDLTYKNIVEIVKTSNTVGRRNQYSVVGNQDPTMEPQEIDSDRAEIVKILPPFGNAGLYIIITITTIIAIGLLAGGIVFIRRKILKK